MSTSPGPVVARTESYNDATKMQETSFYVRSEDLDISMGPTPTPNPRPDSTTHLFGANREQGGKPYSMVQLYGLITLGAVLGSLIRVEVAASSEYAMYPAYAVLYANVLGCGLMGFLLMKEAWLASKNRAVYIGLGVGFCGCITSFSSWQLQATQALLKWPGKDNSDHSGVGEQILGSITVQMIGLSTSASALAFMMMLTEVLSAYPYVQPPPAPSPRLSVAGDYQIAGGCLFVCLLIVILNITGTHRQKYGYTCLFAPVGALSRYYLSGLNKPGLFPWGTFIANMIGTVIYGICNIVLDTPRDVKLGEWEYSAIFGLAQGFCGCMTTVSTFMVELRKQTAHPSMAFKYASASMICAQLLLLITTGIYNWAHGFEEEG